MHLVCRARREGTRLHCITSQTANTFLASQGLTNCRELERPEQMHHPTLSSNSRQCSLLTGNRRYVALLWTGCLLLELSLKPGRCQRPRGWPHRDRGGVRKPRQREQRDRHGRQFRRQRTERWPVLQALPANAMMYPQAPSNSEKLPEQYGLKMLISDLHRPDGLEANLLQGLDKQFLALRLKSKEEDMFNTLVSPWSDQEQKAFMNKKVGRSPALCSADHGG